MEKRVNFLVYAACDDSGMVTPLSLETLNAAKQVAVFEDAAVSVLVIGEEVSRAVDELQYHLIDKIFKIEGSDFKQYKPRRFLAVFEKIYRMLEPQLTVFCNSKNSLDFAARAAIHVDAALVTDCVRIEWDHGKLAFTKPVYSNNVMAVYSSGDLPCMVTLRSKSTAPSERSEKQQVEIIDLGEADLPAWEEYEVVEKGIGKDGGKKLADADLIIAGGRGMGGPEGFSRLQKLADLLDGQVGSSRPPCDLGWIPANAQVGITGAIVSPAVYFAVGLSGSFQHMAGMSSSKTIIAINSDPNANIFKISDYGIVGEYQEVLAGLIKEVGDVKSQCR
jgi:electron transfer flavoprotein alpha subunit